MGRWGDAKKEQGDLIYFNLFHIDKKTFGFVYELCEKFVCAGIGAPNRYIRVSSSG